MDDASVEEGHQGQRQKISLDNCLQAFTMEEELGSDELYHCGKCKKPQLAKKKLDMWRLPPVLVSFSLIRMEIHLDYMCCSCHVLFYNFVFSAPLA